MSKGSAVNHMQFARCNGCPLSGRPIVPGSGNKNHPDIAFVAEAPGETEVQQGVPLIGRSGQFLRKVLEDLGIDEDKCYFTNTCLCHPSGNATPSSDAARACLPRLASELSEIRPKLIVALGNVSSKYLAGHKITITKAHGMYQEVELHSKSFPPLKIGVVPTFHPSGVIRNPDLFRDFVDELEYAKSIMLGEVPIIEPPYENYTHITTQAAFEIFVEELAKHNMASCDLETTSTDWFDGRILCIGFSWKRGSACVVDWELIEQNWKNTRLLNDALAGVNLVFQNGIFDIPFLYQAGITNAFYYLDTMQAHYLIDERQMTHGLERMAMKWYRAPAYKTQFWKSLGIRRLSNDEFFSTIFANAPKSELFDYNGADADYTFRLALDLTKEVEEEGQINVLRDIEMPSCRTFCEFTRTGLLVDREYLEKLGTEWKEEENRCLEKMREQAGPNFNPNSTKQLAHYLYDVLKVEPFGGQDSFDKDKIDETIIAELMLTVDDPEAQNYWTSRRTFMSSGMKGGVSRSGGSRIGLAPRSTSAYMLYWLRQQHEFPDLVLKWRHVRKRISLYYNGLKNEMYKDGRIRPHYNTTATKTGRKSSEHPAIHNLPRGDEIYNIVIPDPGWCLIHADYSQAEMRMMAHYSEDKKLIHILNTTDPHTVMAMKMFHLTEEDVKKMSKDELGDKRIAAKMVTFGLPYGRSSSGLAPQLRISKEEAQAYIDAYFAELPVLKDWIDRTRQRGIEEHVSTSVFGRKRRFPLITDKSFAKEVGRQAGNHPIQSAINDLTLIAYVRSIDKLREAGIPVHPGAHIHDSVNFSVPKSMWVEAVKIIIDTLAYVPFKTDLTFPCECEIGERWGEMVTVHKYGRWIEPNPEDKLPEWMLRRGTTITSKVD